MDIELLKTLLEVNRTRHFGKAAEHLHITQSAVSARIRALEETLGVALFSRKRNAIHPTAAGGRLLKHAETIVQAWERARQDTALGADYTASLAVGGVYDLWDVLLHAWLWAVHRDLPGVALRTEAQPAEHLVRRLLDGALDLAFVFEPPPIPELDARQVGTVGLVLVSSTAGLTPAAAMAQDYVMVDWGQSFAVTHSRLFPDTPAPGVRLGLGSHALAFLRARGGSAYLAESAVRDVLARGELFAVANAPRIERFAYALYRSGSDHDALIRKVLATLR